MSGFLSHLVSNHINSTGNVMPRLKGQFETFQQTAPDNLSEGHIENGISNNLRNQAIENKIADTKISTSEIQNEMNIDGSINVDNKNQPIFKPVNIHSYIPDANKNQQIATNHLYPFASELNSSDVSKLSNASLINNSFNKIVKDDDKFNDDISEGANKNSSERTTEKHLLVSDTKITVSNSITKQNYPDEQKNGAEHLISKQAFDNSMQQSNLAVVNAFRLMQNKDAPAGSDMQESTQIIKVNIGRIDVRAVTQQTPVREIVRPKPSMSLDDFLKKEKGSKQ